MALRLCCLLMFVYIMQITCDNVVVVVVVVVVHDEAPRLKYTKCSERLRYMIT